MKIVISSHNRHQANDIVKVINQKVLHRVFKILEHRMPEDFKRPQHQLINYHHQIKQNQNAVFSEERSHH